MPGAALGDAARDPSLFEGFARSAREALRSLGQGAGPWAEGLAPLLADPGGWEAPETLPNGDILIRRKLTADPDRLVPLQPDPDAPAIDL